MLGSRVRVPPLLPLPSCVHDQPTVATGCCDRCRQRDVKISQRSFFCAPKLSSTRRTANDMAGLFTKGHCHATSIFRFPVIRRSARACRAGSGHFGSACDRSGQRRHDSPTAGLMPVAPSVLSTGGASDCRYPPMISNSRTTFCTPSIRCATRPARSACSRLTSPSR